MSKNRKAAEAVILKYIDKLLPGSPNKKMYEELFLSMSDTAFDGFMSGLKDGTINLTLISPNYAEQKLSVERNFDLADELGHKFFERVWMDHGDDRPPYLSNVPYLVVDLPVRRVAQVLIKKIAIPEHNNSIDDLTGQVTGASKGSKISYPELGGLAARGLDATITELIKYRGGDVQGGKAMDAAIAETGRVSIDALAKLNTRVKSTDTLSAMLTAMHLSNTL